MALKVYHKRFYRYLYLRLIRQSGTAHQLALGVAVGIFFGFVVPVLQMLFAIAFAWLLGCNRILAAACTWVSNPLTYGPFWGLNVWVGSFFINLSNPEAMDKFLEGNFETWGEWWEATKTIGLDGTLMFLSGGTLVGGVLGLLSYGVVFKLISDHQKRKKARLNARRSSLQSEGV